MMGALPMADVKEVVGRSPGERLPPHQRGARGVRPSGVDAVVSVATSRLDEDDLEWSRLPAGHDGRPEAEGPGRGYETFVLDAREVLDGLETIMAADIVEDVVEEALEEALENWRTRTSREAARIVETLTC